MSAIYHIHVLPNNSNYTDKMLKIVKKSILEWRGFWPFGQKVDKEGNGWKIQTNLSFKCLICSRFAEASLPKNETPSKGKVSSKLKYLIHLIH